MKKIVGVRFKNNGKVYNFNCGAFVLKTGDPVIVETGKGLGLGIIHSAPTVVKNIQSDKELRKVSRKADKKDLRQLDKNKELEKKAYSYCINSIKKNDLRMNLFSVESSFDASCITFFFTADGRIDFRQLVKALIKKLRVRIEMRQVGVRNRAKMCGGVGRCGQVLCCSSFLNKFEPVSIKMAKRQGLSLNPTKISGQCGRLMCCLTFEDAVYKETKEKSPEGGKKIKKPTGKSSTSRH